MIRMRLCVFATVALGAAAVAIGAIGVTDLPGVVVSRQLAEARGLHVGDIVRLSPDPSSAARARQFRVDGVYEPTPDPMRFAQAHFEARLHLPDLLDLTADPSDPAATDTVSAINIALTDPSRAEAFARDLSARFPS